jgi:hypothetical protein
MKYIKTAHDSLILVMTKDEASAVYVVLRNANRESRTPSEPAKDAVTALERLLAKDKRA